jgi:hypothetical protein
MFTVLFVHSLLHYYGFVRFPEDIDAELILHFPSPTNLELWPNIFRISRVSHKRHLHMHQVYDSGESALSLTFTR